MPPLCPECKYQSTRQALQMMCKHTHSLGYVHTLHALTRICTHRCPKLEHLLNDQNLIKIISGFMAASQVLMQCFSNSPGSRATLYTTLVSITKSS